MTAASASVTFGPDVADQDRVRLAHPLDTDVCVIGAGLAGLSIALEAAKLGASVAVLEGRHVGWNASGHQLGTVMPGFGLPVADLIARVGLEDAREMWALSQQGAEAVRARATGDAIPDLAFSEGALEVSNVDVGDKLIARLQMLSTRLPKAGRSSACARR
jgi:glycine/D-amino acid oxidase-like deaminating enzyme